MCVGGVYFLFHIGLISHFTILSLDRVIANHIIWLFVKRQIGSLSKRFRDAYQEYLQVFTGTTTIPPRWRDCVQTADGLFSFATGREYVEEHFHPESKASVSC